MTMNERSVGPGRARRGWRTAGVVLALLAVGGCFSLGSRVLPQGTPPEKNDWYGEFYNLGNYAKCREEARQRGGGGANDMGCEFYRLVRVEEPEYWPYPQVPRPKLPEAPNPPVYRDGMTSKEYFEALCKAEAGEFIYKTVDNVEGVYQIRPRRLASGDALQDRYVMEDPYGYEEMEARRPQAIFALPGRYRYFEAPLERGATAGGTPSKVKVFSGRPFGVGEHFSEEDTSAEIRSRYGFTWRGIARSHDRELGIAGGELLVLDLRSGELLGIRRGFARSGNARGRGGFNWETAEVCPQLRRTPRGWDKWPDFSYFFLSKVLKPAVRN